MTNLPCGCSESDIIKDRAEYLINSCKKDIEWVKNTNERLELLINDWVGDDTKREYVKDFLKIRTILPLYEKICKMEIEKSISILKKVDDGGFK